jgi:VanZ family protein
VSARVPRPSPLRIASALLPLGVYGGLIVHLSSQSAFGMLPTIDGFDKVLHLVEYAGLGFLAARALALLTGLSTLRAVLWGAGLAAAFGVTDEIHQSFVPGRFPSVSDAVADAFGSLLGAWCYRLWAGLWRRAPKEAT